MTRQAEAMIPTTWGNFNMIAYSDSVTEAMPHLALVHEKFDPNVPTLLRIHSECMTGDVFGSKRCDCGEQLHKAFEMAAEAHGAIIYLRQEGRGIGLINKLKAYQLQDTGLNTVDANLHLGFEIDTREYDIATQMMQDVGIRQIRLMTNNPEKLEAMQNSSIEILERVPIIIDPQPENLGYLQTKKDILGHFLAM
ncbi:MAG: GTP cyclohydrolase II [Bacteroidota bacterium]